MDDVGDAHPDSNLPHPTGDTPAEAGGGLYALLYAELRALAQREMGNERKAHTLSATALVNEVYIKLTREPADGKKVMPAWESDRGQFFAMAAQAMRRILVDHARTRDRQKRGGGGKREDTSGLEELAAPPNFAQSGTTLRGQIDTLALDEALSRLANEEPEAAKVVEMRFFAGLPEATIAQALGVSERTVRRHWTFAKAWLYRELSPDGQGE